MGTLYIENQLLEFVTQVCGTCGIRFALEYAFQEKRLADHNLPFWCPNGHRLFYQGMSVKDQLAEAEREKSNLRAARDAAQEQARHSSIERRKIQTRMRHLKERVKNGICPCCHRQFPALQSHIRQEHPGYVVEVEPT